MDMPRELRRGDVIQTSLLRYQITAGNSGGMSTQAYGNLIAVRWGSGWREPQNERREELVNLATSYNWEMVSRNDD